MNKTFNGQVSTRIAAAIGLLRFVAAAGFVWVWSVDPAPVRGQPQTEPRVTHAPSVPAQENPQGCGRCHYCDKPTAVDRCLYHPCERLPTGAPGSLSVPDILVLDRIDGDCSPVTFEHRRHAAMADMGEGCITCHHYTPTTSTPPPCSRCHNRSAAGTDIDKPGLKGAYHQQCLNCHRDWIDETACNFCHDTEPREVNGDVSTSCETGNGLLAREHPRIPSPEEPYYRGSQPDAPRVTFGHRTHVERFGLRCAECHHEPACARCHARNEEGERRTLAEHHRPCLKCHKSDMTLSAREAGRCDRCHWQEGRSATREFNHADTGWPLRDYHRKLSCRACHSNVPFTALDPNCGACHTDWNKLSFDHCVTGQELDATHRQADCESCHLELRFDRPPVCTECHEPEEDIAFPQYRPGPICKPPDSSVSPAP